MERSTAGTRHRRELIINKKAMISTQQTYLQIRNNSVDQRITEDWPLRTVYHGFSFFLILFITKVLVVISTVCTECGLVVI